MRLVSGGTGQGGLRQAAVLAPDPQRRLGVDEPVGDMHGNEFLGADIDPGPNGERRLDVDEVLLHSAQMMVCGPGDGYGVAHGHSLWALPRLAT